MSINTGERLPVKKPNAQFLDVVQQNRDEIGILCVTPTL